MKLSVSKRNQQIKKIDLGLDVIASDYSDTTFLAGRSKDCNIHLDDKQLSREHLRIIHNGGKWFVEKIDPEYVGLLNGDDFRKVEISVGDSLEIGPFNINIESSDSNINDEVEAPRATDTVKEIQADSIRNTPAQKSEVTQPEPVTEVPQELTKEFDYQPTTQSEPDKTERVSDATTEVDLGVGLRESKEFEEVQARDDFTFSDDAESESLLASSEQEEESSTEEDGDNAYSLENIDSGLDEEGTRILQSFAKVQLELFGETAPYDKYLVEKELTYIGRDSAKCQIVLNDTEVSSVHAVIRKNNIMITLEDLGSSNGTILNGDRINKATLNHGDEFVVGGVTFTIKFKSEFLNEESSNLMPVDEHQTVEVEEIVEIQEDEDEEFESEELSGDALDGQLGGFTKPQAGEKSLIKGIWKDDEKRKKAIYVVVGLVVAWVFFSDDEPTTKAPTPNTSKSNPKTPAFKLPSLNKFTGKKLSEEERRSLSARYEIGKNHYQNGRYREALEEFQKIAAIDPNFNASLQSLIALSKEGLSKLEEQERKRIAEQQAAEKKIKIKELLQKATEYTKDRRIELAQEVFNEISKIDPENIEISKMKMELDDWQKEKARKELEEVTKKKAREEKVEKLKPGKSLYLQKEWFKSIAKFEDFLKTKDMDEDLTQEATTMLKTAREEVGFAVAPLSGKAKSLLEGQDLKGAYEVYQQILKIEPSNLEALNQVGDIKETLNNKARKIYREAIISESLSLFQDAKEKFQEVQQISPVDSDYYKKATDKLRDYLD